LFFFLSSFLCLWTALLQIHPRPCSKISVPQDFASPVGSLPQQTAKGSLASPWSSQSFGDKL
jgi:hypothetical protein